MPVLVNRESGLAENLDDQQAQQAVQNNTHDIPLIDPKGNHVLSSHTDAGNLISQGFRQPKTEELNKLLEHAKYNSTEQQIKAGLEGAAEGIAGPLATAAEKALGVEPKEMLKRREYNPGTHAVGQIAGLAGSMFSGVGEGAFLSKAGEAVADRLAPVLGEKLLGKIGISAGKGLVENAIFQAGDEGTKYLQGDPGQTVESALANVGMSGLFGAGIGGSLGAVGGAWNAATESKAGQFIEDFKARLDHHVNSPNQNELVQKELGSYYKDIKDMASDVYGAKGLKAQEIEKLMPDMSNKISTQAGEVSAKLQDVIEHMESKPATYPERLIGKLRTDMEQLQQATSGEASPSQVFNAIQDLKQNLQSYSKFDKFVKPVDEAYDFVQKSKQLGYDVRRALEDKEVWGKAAERQQSINKAFGKFKTPLEDFEKKFTTEVNDEQVIDPGKVNTYINQLGKPNAEIKQEVLQNFLKAANQYKDVINETHANLGLESPTISSALTATSETLEKLTPGAKVADALIKNGISNILGEGIGAGAGAMVGHPFLGFIAGKHAIAPFLRSILPALVKPLISGEANGASFKAASTLGMEALRGEKLLSKAVDAVVSGGREVISEPTQKSLDKLDAHIDKVVANPKELMQIGNSLHHYLPEHGQVMVQTIARNMQYLAALKPKTEPLGPLNAKQVPSKTAEARYQRALQIAEQPMVVMNKIQNGSLTVADVAHLKTMYPALYTSMTSKLTNELVNSMVDEHRIPYKTKLSLSVFMGRPLEASMNPNAIMANQPQAPAPKPMQMPAQHRTHSMDKLSKLPSEFSTVQQTRTAARTTAHK